MTEAEGAVRATNVMPAEAGIHANLGSCRDRRIGETQTLDFPFGFPFQLFWPCSASDTGERQRGLAPTSEFPLSPRCFMLQARLREEKQVDGTC